MNDSREQSIVERTGSPWLPPLERNEVDRRIWEEELDDFVPPKVFDVHTHAYRWQFNTDPDKETGPFAEMVGRCAGPASFGSFRAGPNS